MPTRATEPQGARILVADDDRITARIVSTKLTGVGHSVTVVSDGQEVLDALGRGEVPDLLITDRYMPRINGVDLVRQLRENADFNDLPIIMVTASGSEEDVLLGLAAGVDDFVTKPFSPDELAARVRTVLWRAGQNRGR
jgi:DNA-binding response OmpR family regulator